MNQKYSNLKKSSISLLFRQYIPGLLIFTGIILMLSVCTSPNQDTLRQSSINPPLESRMNLNYYSFPLDDSGLNQMIQEPYGYSPFYLD